jgi:hypothetical protein
MPDVGSSTTEGFVEFAQQDSVSDVLNLSSKEKELLRLYDESEDLRVQMAILKAGNKLSKCMKSPSSMLTIPC